MLSLPTIFKDSLSTKVFSKLNITIVITSIVLAMLIVIFPWWLLTSVLLCIVFLVIGFNSPIASFLVTIAITCNLLPEYLLPSVGVGGGKVAAADLALVFTVFTCLFHYQKSNTDFRKAFKKVLIPFLLVIAAFFLSIVYSAAVLHTPIKDVLGESKHLFYWVIFPLSVYIGMDAKRFEKVVYGLVAVALVFSLGQIIQGLFGIHVMGGRALQDLETMGHYSDVKRSTTSGIHLIVWSFIFLTSLLIHKRIKAALIIPMILLTLAGILLTYGRMIWAGTFLALVVVFFKVGFKQAFKAISILSILGVIGLGAVLAVKPAIITSAVDRMFSVNDEVSHGQSLAWRFYENGIAIEKIQDSPILGIGLGATYRPPAKSDVTPEQVRYVHNAYLFMIMKMGLVVFVCFMAFIFTCIYWLNSSCKSTNKFHSNYSIVTVSILFEYFMTCMTQPELMQSSGIAFIATLLGLSVATIGMETSSEK